VSTGYRNDQGKSLYHLLPPDALEGQVRVITFGAKKYAERNWERGMAWSRVFNSMMRHSWSFWGGEDIDPESGLPHPDHISTNATFLATYFRRPALARYDDRPHRVLAPEKSGVVDPLADCASCNGKGGYHRQPCALFNVEFRGRP
jgi:hypothetical protein